MPAPQPAAPAPKATGAVAGMFEARKGYSNWYFNTLERDRLYEATHNAFQTTLGVDAVAIFTRGDSGELELAAAHGFGDTPHGVLELQTLPQVRARIDDVPPSGALVEIDAIAVI